MGTVKRKITDKDLVAAARLRALWDQKKADLKLTQQKAADMLDMTQGAINHYLSGRAALGPVATIRFSRLLSVSPKDIRPDFEFQIVPGDMPPDVIEVAVKLASLPLVVRQDVSRLIDTLAGTGYAQLLEKFAEHSSTRLSDTLPNTSNQTSRISHLPHHKQ